MAFHTFAYLDNVYICGLNQEEHDRNLEQFLSAAKDFGWTFNENKCELSTRKLNILGSVVEHGTIKPDPERLRPLRELPLPHDSKSMKRVLGLFSHYSKWIPKFSDKVAPLISQNTFPLGGGAVEAFEALKVEIENSVVQSIDESKPFELECDASDIALAGVLNQSGRPVAFFSRTLHGAERKWPSVEKEACAIIESVRNWRHYLTGHHFRLITDQESVSFMFNQQNRGKIKNDKIYRWRLELSCYSFDISYRPGEKNVAPDTFTRVYCSAVSTDTLYKLHDSLCHPGVTRMHAFVHHRHLPFSIEDIRAMTKSCRVCCECKPRFFKPSVQNHLIKATQPMERLNVDFKGPLPSITRNKYMLTVVDEFSRYPFAIPVPDLTASTVNRGLSQIFSMFGISEYVHSDRGSNFMSSEVKNYLHGKGIVTSRTTPYHPQGNGQTERFNGTIWKAITLALKSRNLPVSHWETVLPDVLHSIRTLISTATNVTPHERMFTFQRRTSSGISIPSWLSSPGPVLLKRHVRRSKFEPLVDTVELLEANPRYAHIRHGNGTESTVSLSDLAPLPRDTPVSTKHPLSPAEQSDNVILNPPAETEPSHGDSPILDHGVSVDADKSDTLIPDPPLLRRSERVRRPPPKFDL